MCTALHEKLLPHTAISKLEADSVWFLRLPNVAILKSWLLEQ